MKTDRTGEEEEEEEEPQLETVMIQHTGAVNRLRVCGRGCNALQLKLCSCRWPRVSRGSW